MAWGVRNLKISAVEKLYSLRYDNTFMAVRESPPRRTKSSRIPISSWSNIILNTLTILFSTSFVGATYSARSLSRLTSGNARLSTLP